MPYLRKSIVQRTLLALEQDQPVTGVVGNQDMWLQELIASWLWMPDKSLHHTQYLQLHALIYSLKDLTKVLSGDKDRGSGEQLQKRPLAYQVKF